MNQTQISLTRQGVMSTAIRSGKTGVSRAGDRAAVLEALNVYGLTGDEARCIGGWCMAQMGYGGGL